MSGTEERKQIAPRDMDGDGDIDSDDDRLWELQQSTRKKKAQMAQLQKDVDHWKSLYEQQQKDQAVQEANLQSKDATIQTQQKELKCLKEMMEEIKRQDQEIEDLKKEKKDLTEVKAQNEEQIKEAARKEEVTKEDTEKVIADLGQQILTEKDEKVELEDIVSQLKHRINELEDDLAEQTKQHNKIAEHFMKDLEAANEKIAQLEAENAKLKECLLCAETDRDQAVKECRELDDKIQKLDVNLRGSQTNAQKQKEDNESLKQDIEKGQAAVLEMMAEAQEAMANAPDQDDMTGEFDRMVTNLKQIPERAAKEVTNLIDALEKDMQVWHDKQMDEVKATKAGIQSRSQAFENIVKTFEKLQEGMQQKNL